ncbi:MAG: inositol 2-dehydrogenase [Rhodoferax sp.]|nr:inositol 2-dehydrogenase [Rhodoferax sp.]MDP3652652.1 inositol 2-dehydrogenase [Rhodoferax sp.]
MKHIAVFGAGRIGRIHATNLAAQQGVKLKYVCDALPTAAADLAQQVGAVAADIDTVLADPAIDAVLIGSPTTTHSDLITRAAQAGKHIFCEKPVDLSAERAQACAATVAQAGVACMIGFQRRFDPTFNEAKTRLDRGDIGNPEMLVITSRDPGAPPVEYIQQSGGIFRDMLIHDFDVFRWILCGDGDKAAWLSATGSCLTDPAIGQAGDFDCTAVTIKTVKGRLCQINTTRRAAYGYDQRFEVIGSQGMLQCGNHRPSEVTQANAQGTQQDNPEAFFLQRYAAAYRLEIEHFFTVLQNGGTFRTTVQDGVDAQILADAAAKSAATNQVITFN